MTKAKPEYKPPWFTIQVIGIAGPSASGKTSVAKALVKKLNVPFPRSRPPLIYNRNNFANDDSGTMGRSRVYRLVLQTP